MWNMKETVGLPSICIKSAFLSAVLPQDKQWELYKAVFEQPCDRKWFIEIAW